MRVSWVAVFMLLLSGCTDPPTPSAPTEPDPCLVVRPDDTSCDAASTMDARPHLHDYWAGQDRLVLLEQTHDSPVGFAGGPIAASRFRPEPGDVVPQGTARVEVTLTWTTQPDDHMGGFHVAVKSAATNDFVDLGPAEAGVPVAMATTHGDNDLPHQVVSNWLFDAVVQPGSSGIVHYWGQVTLKVEVVRGLDIPLYPGHPDRWQGRDEVALVDETLDVSYYQGDPESTFYSCGSQAGCFRSLRPADGAIVPTDAAAVLVELAWTNAPPFSIGLRWHAADAIEFQDGAPGSEAAGHRTYVLPVSGVMGDGPYATQSLWEFLPVIEGPVAHGVYSGQVTIRATAVRTLP